MIFRILLLITNTLLLVFSYQTQNLIFTSIILLGLLILQVFFILKREKREQEKIITYLESIILDETSVNTPSDHKSVYYKMNRALREITERSHLINIEKQEKADLLNALLDHINIGLLTYDSKGEIEIQNKAARNLLSISYLSNIAETKIFTREETEELLDFSHNISKVYKIRNNRTVYIESSDFTLHHSTIRIISIQNIDKTLDEKEMDSWNVLIQTLNHEIMNSITPISSLASSALTLIDRKQNSDLTEALETIERRSRNLMKFVDNYRTLSQIPTPQKELINLLELFKRITILMSSFAEQKEASIYSSVEEDELLIYGDLSQVEQILINLIKNSLEARATTIKLSSKTGESSTVILSVTDNGSGFSDESETKAFIPFYTTKSSGSGLGLSMVRQIMHLHGGEVKIESHGETSTVLLYFP